MTTWQERADALPDWAIEEANRRAALVYSKNEIKQWADAGMIRSLIAHAEDIAKHEPAPVCPKLAAAREACARMACTSDIAANYRAGNLDYIGSIDLMLSAINIYLEQNNDR